MAKVDKRFFCVVGGAHSGKSNLIDKLTKGRPLTVYNTGHKGEFSDCKLVDKVTKDKRKRMYKVFSHKEQNKIALDLYHKCYGNIVLDDALSIFRHGVSEQFGNLLSKINHTCKGRGANLFVVFHNFEQLNSTVLDYTTDFLIFKSDTVNVKFRRDLGEHIVRKLKKAVKLLHGAPKYSYVHINLKTL